jgi:proteasome lid subunit RPN8/RPN11
MFGAKVDENIRAHALACFPRESCGFIVKGEYIALINQAEGGTDEFRISDNDFLKYSDGIQAVVHSHPANLNDVNQNKLHYPSKTDMAQQMASNVPWAICVCDSDRAGQIFWFGEGAPKAPLVGRGFRHGVTDCYSLIRDWYKANRGVTLKEFARQWEWWDEPNGGQRFYDDRFSEAGFIEVANKQPINGDVLTMFYPRRDGFSGHAGIYLGDGTWMHHLAGRYGYAPEQLSRRDALGPWARRINRVLRFQA